ncbi:hypothetical protein F7Q99_30090 [Streptomyces kaniharaensis]|uniref:PknH-like extracellular domain-containing protein n=1 Tax=Streptomyces kaniharaensis TaxID=212423 RepID=A0A6N7L0Y8_9ACTN|nr:hypothetical protein [Streptomyces kaniharaensis]MQS16347.1 hypothetical protein [Streptomyces kaniharaensis]
MLANNADSTVTGAPNSPSSSVSIESMPCSELAVDDFLTTHARPSEDVSVGLEKPPASRDDYGWFGQESLDRYVPGQAAAVMAAIRGTAQRCTSYTDTLPAGGSSTKNAVSTAEAGVPADDSLMLRISSTIPDDPEPYITEVALVREGDVILTVRNVVTQKPSSGVEAVLPAALAAYRAAAHNES